MRRTDIARLVDVRDCEWLDPSRGPRELARNWLSAKNSAWRKDWRKSGIATEFRLYCKDQPPSKFRGSMAKAIYPREN